MHKPVIGVMGASMNDALTADEQDRLRVLTEKLGVVLAQADCILMTGATTGLPRLVATAFRKHGGFTVGVSPAENREEHMSRYGLPGDGADVMIYTGFGYKGRNVVNVRSSDIVLLVGGATGTLNEFTIAYDEGKLIGVLEGSGGVADHAREIIDFCKKSTKASVYFDKDPVKLVEQCLQALEVSRRVGSEFVSTR